MAKYSDIQKTQAVLAYVKDGKPAPQVAQELGIETHQSVLTWVKNAGYKLHPRGRPSTRVDARTPAIKAKIVALVMAGLTPTEIGVTLDIGFDAAKAVAIEAGLHPAMGKGNGGSPPAQMLPVLYA